MAMSERLRTPLGRRATGIALALLAELLLLLALLSLNQSVEKPKGSSLVEVDLTATDMSEPAPEQPEPEKSEPQPNDRPAPQPVETAVPVAPQPMPPPVIPLPTAPVAPPPAPARPAPPAAANEPAYGPPDTGGPRSDNSERVGTAPNGEPLYAAQWYRRPGKEFDGYLTQASPGYGLMACRTIPDFYVTDCVALGETQGSMLTRSMLAGSGVLRVRPPRLGGRSLVGAWVRIRIDYTIRRE
jgi:protein TonB